MDASEVVRALGDASDTHSVGARNHVENILRTWSNRAAVLSGDGAAAVAEGAVKMAQQVGWRGG
jgi:hypothetical protein